MKISKIYIGGLLTLVLIGGGYGINYSINAINSNKEQVKLNPDIYKIEINENGETYGTYEIDENGETIEPELMAVVGVNNVEGYVRKLDLYDEANQPNNPEEAIEYMKKREKEGSRIIPVYEKDGKTVIGEFRVD